MNFQFRQSIETFLLNWIDFYMLELLNAVMNMICIWVSGKIRVVADFIVTNNFKAADDT